MNVLARLRTWCIDTTNSIAHFVRDNRGATAAILSGIVLAIMVYGTFVSVILPKQRMNDLRDAYAAGDFLASIEIAQKIVDSNPRNIKAALALAAALLQQGILDGNVGAAVDRARNVLRGAEAFATLANDQSEVSRQLGYTYILTREYDRAHEYLANAAKLDPDNAMAYAHLCYYFDVVNNDLQAQATCERALEIDPENSLAMIGLVKMFIADGDLRQARLYSESAVFAAEDRIIKAKAHVASAHVNIAAFDLETARTDVANALAENPKEFDALVLSGELAMRSLAAGALNGAEPMKDEAWIPMLRDAAQAMRINPSDYYPYLLFMRAYEISGNTEAADKHRAIATRIVNNDKYMDANVKKQVLERLNAANNVELTGIRLVETGTPVPAGGVQVYIKQ